MPDSLASTMSTSADGCNDGKASPKGPSPRQGCLFDGNRSGDVSSNSSRTENGLISPPPNEDATPTEAQTALSAASQRKSRVIWTDEEDAMLLAIVEEKDRNKIALTWSNIADQLGSGRSGKQCRDRYLNHLRNGIKKGKWTEEEERLLLELHDVFGARWASMAKLFGTRTDNDIKNKWNSMVRKKRRVSQRSEILAAYNHQNSLLQMQRNAAMFPLTANDGHLAPHTGEGIDTTDVAPRVGHTSSPLGEHE